MTQLVQKSRPHFFTKKFLIRFRNVPNVFQKQNNLRRHRHIIFFHKFRAGEQTQRVHLDSIRLQFRVRLTLKNHRHPFRTQSQRFRQRRERFLNFRQRKHTQFFQIQIHTAILTRDPHQCNFRPARIFLSRLNRICLSFV
jgi:hypothetical protein